MKQHWRTVRGKLRSFAHAVREFRAIAGPMVGPFVRPFKVIMVLLAIDVLLESVRPFLWGRLTDALVAHRGSMVIAMLIALTVRVLANVVVSFVRDTYEDEHVLWDMNLLIMTTALERISALSMAQFSAMHSAKIREVVGNGRTALRELVRLVVYRLGVALFTLIVSLVVLLYIQPLVGLVILTGTIIYGILTGIHIARFQRPIRDLEDAANDNSKTLGDTLLNMDMVKAFAREQRTTAEFHDEGRSLVTRMITFWRRVRPMYYVRDSVAALTDMASMAITAALCYRGSYSLGFFVALTQWGWQALEATRSLGQMQREVTQHWARLELYINLLRQPTDIQVNPNATCPERLRGTIEFDHVTFEYQPRRSDDPLEEPVPVVALKDVSFSIGAGEKVALVGESGAGKSTIAYAIIRAGDVAAGSIRIDGSDIRSMDLSPLRRRIGYVQQHPRVFDYSLRRNLLFGLGDGQTATDDDLVAALRTVKLEHLAANGGLDRRLGEGGYTLSGGERQRLCIARALIGNPDILIFDEATSSLDPVNEKKVQDAIDAIRGRTKLIIAHRYSTIRDVDRILVFERGLLIDDGSHQELMMRCPYYHMLLEQQGVL